MKYCPNCGAQLPDDAKFCASCGTPLAAPQQPQQQYQQPYQQAYQQPQAEQAPQKKKFFSMDNFRANLEAQKQRRAKMKWWHWALIAIGTYILIQMGIGA